MALRIAVRLASGIAATALAAALLCLSVGVARADTTVTIGSATVAVGQSFVIPVSIAGITDPDGLGAYDFRVTYAASAITITGCSSGTDTEFAEPAVCNARQPGVVLVNDFHGNRPGPTGDMVLFTLSGAALGAAGQATDLALTIVNFGDTDGNEIARAIVNGRISIVAAGAPTMIPTIAPTVPPAATPTPTTPSPAAPTATAAPSGSPAPSPTIATPGASPAATAAASPAPGASPAATATATPRPPAGATPTSPPPPTATPTPTPGETNWFLVGGLALLVVGGLALLVVLWRAVRR